jgi:hypothetical protein
MLDREGNLPDLVFICPVPVGKAETHLQVFGLKRPKCSAADTGQYQVQMGSSSFGRVVNCVVTITTPPTIQDLLVLGGEDCTAKVYTLPDLQLLQETTLSKNSTLKSLATVSTTIDNDISYKGIVLGGGGKLLYYLWSYDFTSTNSTKLQSHTPLRKLTIGSVWPKATQDHRILSTQCIYSGQTVDAGYHFLLFICDSRGVMNILQLQLDFDARAIKAYNVAALYELGVSCCPLLSCAITKLSNPDGQSRIQGIVSAVGDTKGSIYAIFIHLALQSDR